MHKEGWQLTVNFKNDGNFSCPSRIYSSADIGTSISGFYLSDINYPILQKAYPVMIKHLLKNQSLLTVFNFILFHSILFLGTDTNKIT